MVPGPMPAAASASSFMRKWVVLAGWITRLRQSPTLARWLNSLRVSMNTLPWAREPFRSKLNTLPAPRAPWRSRRSASAWLGCDASSG